MPNTGIEWIEDPVSVWMPKYKLYVDQITEAIETTMVARREEITGWMKANHLWQNRTSIAEEGLFTDVMRDGLIIVITMGHGLPAYYSRFLERFMQPVGGGRGLYSVLGPALDYWGPILLDDVRKLLA